MAPPPSLWSRKSSEADTLTGGEADVDPFDLHLIAEGTDPDIDIVFIHGLQGHYRTTWTADNEFFWPQQVSEDLKNARVLSWGYDANVIGDRVSMATIDDHARQLIFRLRQFRSETESEQRPIIFIVHSLGGIVLKDALMSSDSARKGALEEHRAIKISTYGIIFMGTPHQGGNAVSLAEFFTTLAHIYTRTTTTLLQHLKRDSGYLQKQLTDFAPISPSFKTVFAYETYSTQLSKNGRVMVVPKESAVVPGTPNAAQIMINEDHLQMVKFKSQQAPGYRSIISCLREWKKDAGSHIAANWRAELGSTNESHIGVHLNAAPHLDQSQFVGRQDKMDELYKFLQPQHPAARRRLVKLGGMGGIGKTQLAVHFARCFGHYYTSVFWIYAHSEASIGQSFRRIAGEAKLDLAQTLSLDEVQRSVLEWFSTSGNSHWLLIYDNHDTPQDFDIKCYLPSADQGTIIITTRSPDRIEGHAIKILCFAPDSSEAMDLFRGRSERSDAGINLDARNLVERFNGHPLALATAAASLRNSSLSYAKYLDHYEQEWTRLRDLSARRPLPDYQQHSIPQTRTLYSLWNITFDQVLKRHSAAARLLIFLSHFDNQRIWYDLLHAGVQRNDTSWFADVVRDEISLDDALQTLAEYSLVEVDEQRGSFGLHACVHDWVSGEKNNLPDPELCWRAVACVAHAIDATGPNAPDRARLLAYEVIAHAGHVTQQKYRNTLATGIGVDNRAEMLLTIAKRLGDCFHLRSAENLLRFLLKRPLKGYVYFEALRALGTYLRNLKRLEEAEAVLSAALSELTCLPPMTVIELTKLIAYQLGMVLVDRRKPRDAVLQFEHVLQHCADSQHLLLQLAKRGLSQAHLQLGNADKAVALQRDAYEICVQVHGRDHWETLHEASMFGRLLQLLGRHEEARVIVEANVEAKKAKYPERPVHWIHDRFILSRLQAVQDDLSAGVHMFEQAFPIGGSELGQRSAVYATMRYVGNSCLRAGDLKRATKWLEPEGEDHAAILGPDHQLTLLFKADRAILKLFKGHHEEAVTELESLLAICQQRLDPADALRIYVVLRLAEAYDRSGQLSKFRTTLREALDAAEASARTPSPDDISDLEAYLNSIDEELLRQL